MEWIFDPNHLATFFVLTLSEIILGVDNLVFISILTEPLTGRKKILARRIGLALALITRLLLLASLAWVVRLTEPILSLGQWSFSWRDIILISGGIYLLYKATKEIHKNIEAREELRPQYLSKAFRIIIIQIMILDIIFSLDSIIMAVGLAQNLGVMATAVIVAVIVMFFAVNPICNFIERHPTVKMLALAFLILIGVVLVADGFQFHIPRQYIYAAMGFSLLVESLNLFSTYRRNQTKVKYEEKKEDRDIDLLN